jgi:hypothetical protein
MPERWPRKVDNTGVSSTSDIAVVMALIFGRGDGEEWVLGDSRQLKDHVMEA